MKGITISAVVISGFLLSLADLAEAGDWGKNPKAVTYEETSLLKGDFEVTLGKTWLDGELGGTPDELDTYSGELQLGMDIGDHYFAQFDLLGEKTDARDGYQHGYAFAGHLMRRNSDAGGLGVFGGTLTTDQDNGTTDTSNRYFFGLEGQVYRQNATFFGQVGYLDGTGGSDDDGEDSIREAVFARGGVQYFLNEDLMIEAEVSGAFGKMDDDAPPLEDAEVIAWGVKAEKRLTNYLSGAIGYQGAEYFQDEENDRLNEHVAYLSFTVLFDQDTLQARSRKSTSLDTPQILRWSAQTGGPLED